MNALQVDARVCDVRHGAGPVGWLLLEHLAMHAADDGAALVVVTSVRDLAAAVSLNKDTVARTVGVLAGLGLVTRHQPASGGRFAGGQYVLALPVGLSVLQTEILPAPVPSQLRAHADHHARAHVLAQLSLLDLADHEPTATLDGGRPTTPKPTDALAPAVPGDVREWPRPTQESAGEADDRPC